MNVGRILIELNNFAYAYEIFQMALIQIETGEAMYNIAFCCYKMQHFYRAKEYIESLKNKQFLL